MLSFRRYAITDRRYGSIKPRLGDYAPGTLAVQLRDKDLPPHWRRQIAEELREATSAAGHLLFIGGGDVDLALDVGADGVHLPTGYLPRPGTGLLFGASCHDAAELVEAVGMEVDFVTISPVRGVPQKRPPMGWWGLAPLAAECPLPVFALGGLGPEDVDEAVRWGAWGGAGIRGFLEPWPADAEP